MLLEEGLDTGPILLQREIPISPEQTAADLFDVLAKDGAPLVVETLAGLNAGTIKPQLQDHSRATLAPILDREDGRMDFAARTATELWNRWRGFQPWPGAYTTLEGKKLIAHQMRVAAKTAEGEPGKVDLTNLRLQVACAQNTWIEITELQLEGKKHMAASDFLRGAGLRSGIRLG
jgi:methionyl-tRNA formyltransferase